MIRRAIKPSTRVVLVIVSVLTLIGAYAALSYRQKQRNPTDTVVPNLTQLVDGAKRAFAPQTRTVRTENPDGTTTTVETKDFFRSWWWRDSVATWGRLFVGLALGVAAGVVLGLLMGCYPPIAALFQTPLDFLSKIPPTAMLAIFFVVLGTGFDFFVGMIAFGILPTLTQSVYLGARKGVPQELVDKAITLGASQLEIICNVILRQILPTIIESARLCVGPALVYLIAAEMLVADVGFGYRLRIQSRLLDMSVVYIYLAILGVAGYVIDLSLRWLIAKTCPWFVKHT